MGHSMLTSFLNKNMLAKLNRQILLGVKATRVNNKVQPMSIITYLHRKDLEAKFNLMYQNTSQYETST